MQTRNDYYSGGVTIVSFDRIACIVAKGQLNKLALPKGHQEPSETSISNAWREVKEETGFVALFDTPLNSTCSEYEVVDDETNDLVKKRVRYFRIGIVGGRPENLYEVEDVTLITPRSAIRRLTHRNEREAVRKIYL